MEHILCWEMWLWWSSLHMQGQRYSWSRVGWWSSPRMQGEQYSWSRVGWWSSPRMQGEQYSWSWVGSLWPETEWGLKCLSRQRVYIYTTLGCPFLRMYLWGSLDLVFTHMPGECYRSLLGSVVVALTMCATSAECHQFLYDARPNLLISSSFFFLSFNLYFFQL